MALETGTYISDLVSTNPTSTDPKSQGDDHIRLVKSTVKATFPNISGAVTPTHTELNYVDGVTSAIQAQIDLKSPTASPTFTGTPAAPTATVGTNTTQLATTAFVVATSLDANLPGQTGNAGKIITTDGTTASWSATLDNSVVTPATGTAIATTTGTQTLTNKSIAAPLIVDSSDVTKKASFVASGITTATTRTYTLANNDVTVDTPAWRLIAVSSPSAAASPLALETTFDSTYDDYMIVANFVEGAGSGGYNITMEFKIGGSYITSSSYHYHFSKSSSASALYVGHVGNPASDIQLIDADFGSENSQSVNIIINLFNTNSTALYKNATVNGVYLRENGEIVETRGVCGIRNAGALQGVRFLNGSSFTGTFKLFGLRKAI
jgi:hypothetical protein